MLQSKIFGLGLPRTGTTSLAKALNVMNVATKHFPFELYQNLNSQILDEYIGFVDSPIPLIWKELDQRFPNAKFILTIRTLDRWLESMEWLFSHGKVKWNWSKEVHEYHKVFFGTERFNETLLSKKYHEYQEDIFKSFENRPQDLLILNLELEQNEGFHKLATFLNLSSPDLEFPHIKKRTKTFLPKRIYYEIKQFIK